MLDLLLKLFILRLLIIKLEADDFGKLAAECSNSQKASVCSLSGSQTRMQSRVHVERATAEGVLIEHPCGWQMSIACNGSAGLNMQWFSRIA